ncbi:unnamed protein product [Cuscuta campestris]|uniref:Reverse transcriptase Ty1/copia-type domain-containing protein n=1 Tax=Cuscuta campestris TaxID=132261 RepID=A0A484LN22_9ASTE|nr:unnamed protein product [Cuscuta campestris]
MSNSKKGSLPMTPGTVLSKSQSPTLEQKELMMKKKLQTKKYEERYWLYYLSSKGENTASSVAEDGSSNEVLAVTFKKASKRKRVVSSSPSAEEPQDLELVNLDEEEVSAQGQLQMKKKRRISTPSTSGNVNPENSLQNNPQDSPQQLDEDQLKIRRTLSFLNLNRSKQQLKKKKFITPSLFKFKRSSQPLVRSPIKQNLKFRQSAFLVYGGEEELKVVGYTDASFQIDRDDSKSQAGYLFCLNGGAFSWKSFKEDTTVDSTIEAKYIAAAEAAKEAVWIKKFITKLGVVPSINDPISLFCDNTGPLRRQRNRDLTRKQNTLYEHAKGEIHTNSMNIC